MGFVLMLVWKHNMKFQGLKLTFGHSNQRKFENAKNRGFKDLPCHFAPDAKDVPQARIGL
jgi:hypothetical protein